MAHEKDVGIVGGVNVGLPILMTMSAFLAIALYNVVEITFHIFAVFKNRKGIYFWSLMVAAWGIAPHGIGFILKFFQVTRLDLLSSAIVGVGWACMVIGQSVVLYSRLHIVVRDAARIRWVLYMIWVSGIGLGVPLFTLAMGANSKHSVLFLPAFLIFDKVQIVVICVQETIISLIYIYETVRLLSQSGGASNNEGLRKLLKHLVLVNIVVLVFDVSLLAVQFSGHYEIQTTYKTAVYSVKLKIEFSVLNRLVEMVKHKDLVKNRQSLHTNSLSLKTWASSKKTVFSTSPGGPGTFVKMDDVALGSSDGKTVSVKTAEVGAREDATRETENSILPVSPATTHSAVPEFPRRASAVRPR